MELKRLYKMKVKIDFGTGVFEIEMTKKQLEELRKKSKEIKK